MDIREEALKLHKKNKGKLEINSKIKIKNKKDLSLVYTPGVAEPCKEIHKNKDKVRNYTFKGNMVAVVTDWSAVLWLGDIGPEATLPVMEGKCILFKELAGVDAFPICIDSKNTEDIIKTIKLISPGFGGINLEDISAPRCFEIEERLKKELNLPVFHDDQHGTAIVVLAALINSLKVVGKKIEDIKVIINGAGAAGIAVTKLLLKYGIKTISLLDSKGAIFTDRKENMNKYKQEIARFTTNKKGKLKELIEGSDVFIGVSAPNVLDSTMVKSMNKPIIFAMANPEPEINPEKAKQAGAEIIATGRSDFPNQINNVLCFPGIFKGVLKGNKKQITEEMKIAVAEALAHSIVPTKEKIIPDVLDKSVVEKVVKTVLESQ